MNKWLLYNIRYPNGTYKWMTEEQFKEFLTALQNKDKEHPYVQNLKGEDDKIYSPSRIYKSIEIHEELCDEELTNALRELIDGKISQDELIDRINK